MSACTKSRGVGKGRARGRCKKENAATYRNGANNAYDYFALPQRVWPCATRACKFDTVASNCDFAMRAHAAACRMNITMPLTFTRGCNQYEVLQRVRRASHAYMYTRIYICCHMFVNT